jgi:hypothetical protein
MVAFHKYVFSTNSDQRRSEESSDSQNRLLDCKDETDATILPRFEARSNDYIASDPDYRYALIRFAHITLTLFLGFTTVVLCIYMKTLSSLDPQITYCPS